MGRVVWQALLAGVGTKTLNLHAFSELVDEVEHVALLVERNDLERVRSFVVLRVGYPHDLDQQELVCARSHFQT